MFIFIHFKNIFHANRVATSVTTTLALRWEKEKVQLQRPKHATWDSGIWDSVARSFPSILRCFFCFGGWGPFEKYESKWESSPRGGKKIFETATQFFVSTEPACFHPFCCFKNVASNISDWRIQYSWLGSSCWSKSHEHEKWVKTDLPTCVFQSLQPLSKDVFQ